MEEEWQVDRARLRKACQQHPDWSYSQFALFLHRSTSWVKKWCRRLRQAAPEDDYVLKSLSRRPHHLRPRIAVAAVERILAIRDHPPEGLKRVPGPKAIAYYLQKMEETDPVGCHLPTSSSTIWKILDQQQRILRPLPVAHEPTLLAEPMISWQIDFKDVTTVAPELDGKRQHGVETLNMVDTGTSILVDNPMRTDFNAETVIDTVAHTFQQVGCPRQVTFDRDPRFVGSAGSTDFPAAWVRFLACLNIQAEICPPQRPDKNGFVERYNRTYEYEGIRHYRPATLDQAREMNQAVRQHYNFERPNQARSCGNQPPRIAFPDLSPLPSLPQVVDPDGWLKAIDGQRYIRRVNAAGTVSVDKHTYYIGREQHGQHVVLRVRASDQHFEVELKDQSFKVLPIKGLQHQLMTFDDYLTFIRRQAVSEWRHYLRKARVYVRLIT